jgi:hypothetical protein
MTAVCIFLVIILIICNYSLNSERKEKTFYKKTAVIYGQKVHRHNALAVERMLERKFMTGKEV